VPAVLAIADRVEAAIGLDLHNFLDALIFQRGQVIAFVLVLLDGVALVQELGGTQQGAEMFLFSVLVLADVKRPSRCAANIPLGTVGFAEPKTWCTINNAADNKAQTTHEGLLYQLDVSSSGTLKDERSSVRREVGFTLDAHIAPHVL